MPQISLSAAEDRRRPGRPKTSSRPPNVLTPVSKSWIAPLLVALTAFAAGTCHQLGPSRPVQSILLVGVDGFEWDILLPLVRKGEMPTLAGFIERGAHGLLATTRPTFSPIIWTSIATGKSAEQHGIQGFVRRKIGGTSRRLYTSSDRRTKAFWNILSDYGRSVAVVGWWVTYPAEPLNGLMVSQVNTLDQADRRYGRAILKGRLIEDLGRQVFPRHRLQPVLAIHRRVGHDLAELNRKNFGSFAHPMSPLTKRLWKNTQWAFRADATYVEVARQIASEGWDLLAVYLGGADVAGHRFWRHMQPEAFKHPPPPEELEDFGQVIPDYYRYIDRAIAAILAKMPSETTVFVVSDHGMHAIHRGKSFRPDHIPKNVHSAHHRDAPPGVLIAAGPGITRPQEHIRTDRLERSQLASAATIFDITPTVLALLGIPVGADMKGRVITECLADGLPPIGSISSHDTSEWLAARAELKAGTRESDAARLRQLRALGYID